MEISKISPPTLTPTDIEIRYCVPPCDNFWYEEPSDYIGKLRCDDCTAMIEQSENHESHAQWLTRLYGGTPPPEGPHTKETEKQTKQKPFYLITINVRDSVEPEEFFDYVNTYMSTSEYTRDQRYVYTFEQRGESTDDIHGYHAHILVSKKTPKPDNMYTTLRKSLLRKDWIGDNRHVDVKHISEKDLNKVINYLTGQKSEEVKHQKQICDVIMRRKYNLQNYYRNSPLEEKK